MKTDAEFWYKFRSTFAVVLAVAVLLAGGIFVGLKAKNAWNDYRQQDDYIGAGEADVIVTIPRGATLSAISDILVAKDVVRSAKVFDQVCAEDEKRASTIQAGKYRLKTHLPAQKALDMMLDPANQLTNKFRISEGWRQTQIEAALTKPIAEGGLGLKPEDVKAALAAKDKLGLPEYANGNPEGLLFPETYNFPEGMSAADVLASLVAQYNASAAGLSFEEKAKAAGVKPYEALTVASIVELEVAHDEDRAKVARVIYNRLDKGMKLEMDSTVHYAVGKNGKVTTTDDDRRSSSPYNTYGVKGLPPTPIGSPSKASMVAAISPAEGDWLYFTTINLDTGETVFESTYEEHKVNVAKFQTWCKEHGNGRC